MHPTLLIGPADWNPACFPRSDYDARIDALLAACAPGAAGALVFGSPHAHAALAYLTHFTPKLESALAILPRHGSPTLLVGGGANMLGAARPLTFIENLLPLRDVGKSIVTALGGGTGASGAGAVLIGGDAMSSGLRAAVVGALGPSWSEADAPLWNLMRRKSARELDALRAACATLDAAAALLGEAMAKGRPARAAVLEAMQVANRRGAQDVRALVSRDGRIFEPGGEVDASAGPLQQAYLAVQQFGYWAAGFLGLPTPASAKARAGLQAAIAHARTGVQAKEIFTAVAAAIAPHAPHPLAARMVGHGIGLALEEPLRLTAASETRLADGDVLFLQAGAVGADGRSAIASALIVLRPEGGELLWTSPGAMERE